MHHAESQVAKIRCAPWSIGSWVTMAFCALSERLSAVITLTLNLPAIPPALLISSSATSNPSMTGES
jgi:hypothetical protein